MEGQSKFREMDKHGYNKGFLSRNNFKHISLIAAEKIIFPYLLDRRKEE